MVLWPEVIGIDVLFMLLELPEFVFVDPDGAAVVPEFVVVPELVV